VPVAAQRLAAAEHERVGERIERAVAHIGAEPVPDLHDVHRLERLERLAHRVPADAELVHELGLGRHRIAGPEPLLDDQLLDPVLDGSLRLP
jgi:hypothetical protein